MRPTSGLVAGYLLFVACLSASGQNVMQDYRKNRPSPYKAEDPWARGAVMRAQTGWAGLFYNCDGQEDKRFSPYLYWKSQPKSCLPVFPAFRGIPQQYREIKQRICWGASSGAPQYDPPYGTSLEERALSSPQPPAIESQPAPPAPQPEFNSGQNFRFSRPDPERRVQAERAGHLIRGSAEFSLGDQAPAKKFFRR